MLGRLQSVLAHVRASPLSASPSPARTVHWSLYRTLSSGKVPARARAVAVGDVEAEVIPGDPLLVPRGRFHGGSGFLDESELSQETLGHLRWMLQKDALGQDVFLVGPPGPARRRLALLFCELTSKEYELVTVTRDTTEADLKQRRELAGGSASFSDQGPVRAALHGRALILEGLEKAERNVMPTLNNLLENREMALDDGRFLLSPSRYDALVSDGTPQLVLEERKLIRVHPQFRVIAIGLPSPPFPGNPLDPPLRSRFQARYVSPEDVIDVISSTKRSLPPGLQSGLASFVQVLHTLEEQSDSLGVRVPHLQPASLSHVARVMNSFPNASPASVLHRVYPYNLMTEFTGPQESRKTSVASALDKCGLMSPTGPLIPLSLTTGVLAEGTLSIDEGSVTIPIGRLFSSQSIRNTDIAVTPSLSSLFQDLLQDHACGKDICLIGGKGSGKSAIARWFASELGYPVKLFALYADMSARDLFQRRTIDSAGNTTWTYSPLVRAALDGSLCVLDGVDRIPGETIASLSRLLQDRELELFDGTRLLPATVYDSLAAEEAKARVLRVHPSFRVVALALPPSTPKSWLHPEVLGMFAFHTVSTLAVSELSAVLQHRFPALSEPARDAIVRLTESLNAVASSSFRDDPPTATALRLSLRQILRLTRHVNTSAGVPLSVAIGESVKELLMLQFMPEPARIAVNAVLQALFPISSAVSASAEGPSFKPVVTDGVLYFGDVSHPQHKPEFPELVPSPLFYDIPRHSKLLRDMLLDVVSGDHHLLLIGNQGVGKNKLADRALQLLNVEREYMQLHRDSTIQSLTLSPTLRGGMVVWEDSPLVRAVKFGRTLVVDEVDKAPLEVVTVLKSLLEDREMLLADGRRLMDPARAAAEGASVGDAILPIHPKFRLWALANRPGYPFLGNNFFRESGDVFSSHVIDNPDLASERALVLAYAPSMPEPLIHSLTAAFAELRKLNDEGLLAYPYSTREIVAVAKHLQEYPDDGVVKTLENVLAFDSFDRRLRSVLVEVFQKHGIPLQETTGSGRPPVQISLATHEPLPAPIQASTIGFSGATLQCKVGPWVPVRPEQWPVTPQLSEYTPTHSRILRFSEEKHRFSAFNGPLASKRRVLSTAFTPSEDSDTASFGCLHLLSHSPLALHSFLGVDVPPGVSLPHAQTQRVMDLSWALLPASMGGLVKARKGSNGYGSVYKNEKDATVLSIPGVSNSAILLPHIDVLIVLPPIGQPSAYERTLSVYRLPVEGVMTPSSIGNTLKSVFKTGSSVPDSSVDVYSHPGGPVTSSSHIDGVDEDQLGLWKHVPGWSVDGCLLLWQQYTNNMLVLDTKAQALRSVILPTGLRLVDAQSVSDTSILLRDAYGCESLLLLQQQSGDVDWRGTINAFVLPMLHTPGPGSEPMRLHLTQSNGRAPPEHLSVDPSARSAVSKSSHLMSVVGLPNRMSRGMESREGMVYTTPRERPFASANRIAAAVTSSGQLVSGLSGRDISDRRAWDVEVVHPSAQQMWSVKDTALSGFDDVVGVHALPGGDAVVISTTGIVSVVQADGEGVGKDLLSWKQMIGMGDDGPLTLRIREKGKDSNNPPELKDPKHGKEDDENKPHVGGSTWAGGTGGSNTAGLGGRGGPYRLDKGHSVHQVSDAKKAEVSAEAKAKAKEMAQEALAQRLKEINMTPTEAKTYTNVLETVDREISQLRIVLQGAESRSKERSWLKNQSTGDLDDSRLVDGAAGERLIWRRRGEPETNPHAPPVKPTKLHFVLDCSGSMYRFNGQDGRLNRVIEAAVLIMEGFHGLEHKYDYCIVGHSGDSERIPLVPYGKPPANRKERLQVLETMVAHSQFCMSGDTTLEATARAIQEVAGITDSDSKFVFVVSDANLERYGIKPSTLGRILSGNPTVEAHAIFIASFGDEAAQILRALPGGRGHVCMNTADLPLLFRKVFTSRFGV